MGGGRAPSRACPPREFRCVASRYRATLRPRRRISNITSAAPAAIQIIACIIVLLIFVILLFLVASNRRAPNALPVHPENPRTAPRQEPGGLTNVAPHYRDALRFLRRIINMTSAAPAAIQITACRIIPLSMSVYLLS